MINQLLLLNNDSLHLPGLLVPALDHHPVRSLADDAEVVVLVHFILILTASGVIRAHPDTLSWCL